MINYDFVLLIMSSDLHYEFRNVRSQHYDLEVNIVTWEMTEVNIVGSPARSQHTQKTRANDLDFSKIQISHHAC